MEETALAASGDLPEGLLGKKGSIEYLPAENCSDRWKL